MNLGALLILLLVLACPLLMLLMHRGGHGDHGSHGSHCAAHGQMHGADAETPGSLDELRRRRDELDAEIAQLEEEEIETTTPAAV